MGGTWLSHHDLGDPVDRAWEKIARATVEGKLGTHAKVTPCQDQEGREDMYEGNHVISVYIKDFTDKAEMLRVEKALRSLGITEIMKFKPCIFSFLGIYSNNEWKVKPTFYTSCWDEDRGVSIIR